MPQCYSRQLLQWQLQFGTNELFHVDMTLEQLVLIIRTMFLLSNLSTALLALKSGVGSKQHSVGM